MRKAEDRKGAESWKTKAKVRKAREEMRGHSEKHQKRRQKVDMNIKKSSRKPTESRADDDLEKAKKKQEGEVKYRIYRADRSISAIDSPDYLMFLSFHPHDLNI